MNYTVTGPNRHGIEVFGPSLGSYDLAHGIAPTGSSDSHWGRFYGATDGLEDRVPWENVEKKDVSL